MCKSIYIINVHTNIHTLLVSVLLLVLFAHLIMALVILTFSLLFLMHTGLQSSKSYSSYRKPGVYGTTVSSVHFNNVKKIPT